MTSSTSDEQWHRLELRYEDGKTVVQFLDGQPWHPETHTEDQDQEAS